ncbi:LURP-one-related/scramblase family protein [Carnobacterium mobile]|uniref:LURP-one-related/scramblase family protein n=1 Tax=Carnobacterium mobile TaxID=2750 RepID=UPI0005553D93|nr:LURP-one-related family protein [Carnobacterium mobile]
MKLVIKEKHFSLRDTLTVQDEKGKTVYEIKSKLVSLGNKVMIYDKEQQEAASIEENKIGFAPKYTIYQQGEKIAVIKKGKNLIGSDYTIDKLDWKITGNVEKEDFHIKKGLSTIASFKKKLISMGDAFVLDVDQEKDALTALAIVAAIKSIEENAEENKQ